MNFVLRCACAILILLASPFTHAQLYRAYLASYGADSNPCTLAAPCRLLPAALGAVADHGEIWILDSANFNTGTVAVEKSVTIAALPGQLASLVASHGTAAMTTGPYWVRLRNLVVSSSAVSPGTDGIVTMHTDLVVEDCAFSTPATGITAQGGTLRVRHGVFRDQEQAGILVTAATDVAADIIDSDFVRQPYAGIRATTPAGFHVSLSIADSRFTSQSTAVMLQADNGGSVVHAAIVHSRFTNSLHGISSEVFATGGVSVATVSDSLFSNLAGTAMYTGGTSGVVQSAGNNTASNVTDIGSPTAVSMF